MVRLYVVSPMGYYEGILHCVYVFLASVAFFDLTSDAVVVFLVVLLGSNSESSQFEGFSD